MGYETYNTLLAIDATQTALDGSMKTLEIPKKLRKVIEKIGRDAKIKVLILHVAEVLPTSFFKPKFIDEHSDLVDFTEESNEFMFKVGLSLGQKINTILYSPKHEKYQNKFSENLKFVISNLQTDTDVDSIPTLGKLKVKPLQDLQVFEYEIIPDLVDKHFQDCFPERYKLESSPFFKSNKDEICAKIKKQFSLISSIEVTKFTNT
jgi:hypothetical protein